jgi:hypothetical protein
LRGNGASLRHCIRLNLPDVLPFVIGIGILTVDVPCMHGYSPSLLGGQSRELPAFA